MVVVDSILAVGVAVGAVYAAVIAWRAETQAFRMIAAMTCVGCIANAYTSVNSVVGGLPEPPMLISIPLLLVSFIGWFVIISPQLQSHERAARQ